MVDGVPHQVGHGFGESVQDSFVEIRIFAREFEGNIFATVLGDVADHTRKATKKLLNGNHSNLEY